MGNVLLNTLWIYGMAVGVSLLIAVIIKAIVVALDAFERRRASQPAPPPAQIAEAAPLAEAMPAGPPPEHVAAIAAALYRMLGAHRILHIEDTRRDTGWAAQGRFAHHASHAVTRRPGR